MSSDLGDFIETLLEYWPWGTSSSQPKDDTHPKLKDRTPYPPDSQVEILSPVDDAKTIQKRKAADKEFWETM